MAPEHHPSGCISFVNSRDPSGRSERADGSSVFTLSDSLKCFSGKIDGVWNYRFIRQAACSWPMVVAVFTLSDSLKCFSGKIDDMMPLPFIRQAAQSGPTVAPSSL